MPAKKKVKKDMETVWKHKTSINSLNFYLLVISYHPSALI